jgi:hypothetical protein
MEKSLLGKFHGTRLDAGIGGSAQARSQQGLKLPFWKTAKLTELSWIEQNRNATATQSPSGELTSNLGRV